MKAIRKILAVISGLVIASLVVMLADKLSHFIHQPPAKINFEDKEALKIFMQSVPTEAFAVMMAGWIVSSFVGGMITGWIQADKKIILPLVTGGILMAGALMNQYMIPHPAWMLVFTLLFYIPAAYLGGKIGIRRVL